MGYLPTVIKKNIKMLLYLFATFISVTAGFNALHGDLPVLKNDEELQWPDKYTVKSKRISLTGNLIEDLVAWKTNDSSRVDYNNGAVKAIAHCYSDDTVKYTIRPETNDEEEIDFVCHVLSNTDDDNEDFIELDEVLPVLYASEEYEAVANETIVDKETVKFQYSEVYLETETRKTIWASYEDFAGDEDYEEYVWVPVRYEIKEFNALLGALTKHEIWDFSEFDTDFDEDEVFDIIDDYECDSDAVKHTAGSDIVTKELMFIDPENSKHFDHVFNSFKNKHNRQYTHEEEHALRKTLFKQAMRMIASVNRQKLSYKLAVNHFADRTPEEKKRSKGLLRRPEGKSGNIPFPYHQKKLDSISRDLPKEYDLRIDGLVSPVKSQDDCGSCWTFGTTAAVEGALARVNGGRLLSLSNQALLDCSWSYDEDGCDGGTDNAAYEWMMNYGLPTEEEYGPYKNREDLCHINNMTKLYPIRGYTDVTPFNNEALKVALVNHGPLSVSVNAEYHFEYYSSGIFYQKDCDPLQLDHEVALVGYGERDGELFWVLKNSWGTSWGIDGYMLIAAKNNICGVATEPTYVVL